MLANIDASGRAVATARFPGGREYRAIAAGGTSLPLAGEAPLADEAALASVLAHDAIALPCFAPTGGPFAGQPGRLVRAERLDCKGRAALAALYVALMTDLLLDSLDARGEVLIDGPLADNDLYVRVLATLRADQAVRGAACRGGIVHAALHLAGCAVDPAHGATPAMPLRGRDALYDYRARWRRQLPPCGTA
jgi:sugar (pentulose or hexulose) kinase